MFFDNQNLTWETASGIETQWIVSSDDGYNGFWYLVRSKPIERLLVSSPYKLCCAIDVKKINCGFVGDNGLVSYGMDLACIITMIARLQSSCNCNCKDKCDIYIYLLCIPYFQFTILIILASTSNIIKILTKSEASVLYLYCILHGVHWLKFNKAETISIFLELIRDKQFTIYKQM